MSQPPWMPYAWADLGQHEIPGSGTNPRIAEYFRLAGHPEIADDETAWCAAFVGACLEQAGIRCSRSLMARSYLDWGIDAGQPRIGAVTVLARGGDPSLGHVGFLVGFTASDVTLLGGNQSNAVSVATFDRRRVLSYRVAAAASALPPRPAYEPPAAEDPAPAAANTASDARFDAALAHVLAFEGGWSDDPFDPGGATNKGITLADFAREQGIEISAANIGELKSGLRRIADSEVRRIYLERYWRPALCPALPPALALFHFDCAVNQGLGGAARMLQEALGVAIDGEIGPVTLAAAGSADPTGLIERYADIRRRRYRTLSTFWRFGRGWLRRLDATAVAAQTLDTAEPELTPPLTPPPPAPQPATAQKETTPMPDTATAPVTTDPSANSAPNAQPAKWWGESMTIWGACLTAVTTVAPAIFAAFGIEIPVELLQRLGGQTATAIQAIIGLAGTVMTIAGRLRATAPLQRRVVKLRL